MQTIERNYLSFTDQLVNLFYPFLGVFFTNNPVPIIIT